MIAPSVSVVIFTLNEPPLNHIDDPGLKLGAATWGTVYVARVTSLASMPALNARARRLVVLLNIG